MHYQLTKQEIIRNLKLITLVKHGILIKKTYVNIKYTFIENSDNTNIKILILVSKKLLKHAVDRNLIKRRIREIFRQNKHKINTKNDKTLLLNFIYKKTFLVNYKNLEEDILNFINNIVNNNI